MLRRIVPVQYDRPTSNGRTTPSLITCELDDGEPVEVVAKFSAGCDEREVNLARELIGACLAADLGLPVPEPFLIEVSPEWAETVPDPAQRARIQASSPVAFGSKHVGSQFNAWKIGNLISDIMLPSALAIFTFDAIIQNPDRRDGNPNCLLRGDILRIIDHELAFAHGLIIGWRPPWEIGSLKSLEINGNHIFREGLKEKRLDFTTIRADWKDLSDARLREYENAIPTEWSGAMASIARATKLIRDARDNIDACLTEVGRVLA